LPNVNKLLFDFLYNMKIKYTCHNSFLQSVFNSETKSLEISYHEEHPNGSPVFSEATNKQLKKGVGDSIELAFKRNDVEISESILIEITTHIHTAIILGMANNFTLPICSHIKHTDMKPLKIVNKY